MKIKATILENKLPVEGEQFATKIKFEGLNSASDIDELAAAHVDMAMLNFAFKEALLGALRRREEVIINDLSAYAQKENELIHEIGWPDQLRILISNCLLKGHFNHDFSTNITVPGFILNPFDGFDLVGALLFIARYNLPIVIKEIKADLREFNKVDYDFQREYQNTWVQEPNQKTIDAMNEARKISNSGEARFSSSKELFDGLEKP